MISPEFLSVITAIGSIVAIVGAIVTISLSLSARANNKAAEKRTAYDLIKEENQDLIKRRDELVGQLKACNDELDRRTRGRR